MVLGIVCLLPMILTIFYGAHRFIYVNLPYSKDPTRKQSLLWSVKSLGVFVAFALDILLVIYFFTHTP